MNRTLTRAGNKIGVWMYRTLDGRLASGSAKVTVLLLTVPGRRSGLPRSVCLRYLTDEGGMLVWGTGGGSPRDPDWVRNVRAAGTARVQVRADHLTVTPRELTGAECDEAWAHVMAEAPEVAKYAKKAGRTIPVVLLEPLPESPGRHSRP